MKKYLFFIFAMILNNICDAQKPNLKIDSYIAWPEVGGGGLSNNGHYAFYQIRNCPIKQNTFILKTTAGKEILNILNLSNPRFSDDSRYLLGKLPNDTLFIYDLQKGEQKKMIGISQYELLIRGKTEKLILQSNTGVLSIGDFHCRQQFSWNHVNHFKFDRNGRSLIIEQKNTAANNGVICRWIDTESGKEKVIYQGFESHEIIFDNQGKQAAFIVNVGGNNIIYYFKEGNDKAVALVDSNSTRIQKGQVIEAGEYWAFSKDCSRLFFSLREITKAKSQNENPSLEIWNYRDAYLRSFYNGYRGVEIKERHYLSALTLNDKTIRQLISDKQSLLSNSLKLGTDTIFIVESSFGISSEEWNPNSNASYYLCFAKTGQLIPLELKRSRRIQIWNVSPSGKFVVYFDPELKNYVCFDVKTRIKRNISGTITAKFVQYNKLHYPVPEIEPVGITGWLKNDAAVLINTSYDIWRIDPLGLSAPIDITNGIGEKTKTVFYLAGEQLGGSIGKYGNILLSAFNIQTKDYGFYRIDGFNKNGLKQLSMAPRFSMHLDDIYTQLESDNLFISRKTNAYLLLWETANQSPNYFFSKDLENFSPITDVQPQKAYNWLTSELCNYKDSLGNDYQGVLYKPENFDPQKKYPIIFNIYETKSNGLNAFLKPELSGVDFNIPLLVSNGYLVFLPDIKGIVKAPGFGALRSVLAAKNYLIKFPWLSNNKMALVGHSHGGFETDYIITHSNIFASAISGAGMSSMITEAITPWGSGENKDFFTRYGPTMMNSTFSDDPEAYIRNSPLFQAKNLTTPVLFVHNDGDGNVNYQQTQSFFIVLRSLQKPAWWLNYKGQGHGVTGEKNELDFDKKVWSFLDYYLKDKPIPGWMEEHI